METIYLEVRVCIIMLKLVRRRTREGNVSGCVGKSLAPFPGSERSVPWGAPLHVPRSPSRASAAIFFRRGHRGLMCELGVARSWCRGGRVAHGRAGANRGILEPAYIFRDPFGLSSPPLPTRIRIYFEVYIAHNNTRPVSTYYVPPCQNKTSSSI